MNHLLGIKSFLRSQKFSEQQASIAVLQIIARAVYPGSELRTVRCLQENSALSELLGIDSKKVTKDTLYRSATRLGRFFVKWKTICTDVSQAFSI